jgi:hypothetical protein
MERSANSNNSGQKKRPSLADRILAASHTVLKFPFTLIATLLKRAVQVIFSIFVIVLHPGFKWILALFTRSRFVRNYVTPAIRKFSVRYYEPYFAFLGRLPPYWATFSIAVPLAVLEPAKLFATILIAERPKIGVVLWLLLQGLSLILIDKTWTAVRPQSRKIWLVSRVHAWGWLNLAYGKYWITSSLPYRAAVRWQKRIRIAAQAFWLRLTAPRRSRRSSQDIR